MPYVTNKVIIHKYTQSSMISKKNWLKRALWITLGVIALAIVATVIWKGSNKQTRYTLLEVTAGDTIVKSSVLTGSIEPRDLVNIKPQMSGIVAEIFKEAGQRVEAGEIVARIGMIADVQSVQNAQSRVESARVQLNRAKELLDRDQLLYDQKVLPLEKLEESRSAHQRAEIEYRSAREILELTTKGSSAATRKSNNTLVRSTVSGLILERPVKVGQNVTHANNFNEGTTIVSVADLTDLLFVGKVNESDVNKLKVGMDVTISVGALPESSYPAVIEYISPRGQESSGTVLFEVKAALRKGGLEELRAGFSSNATVIIEIREGVLSIPEAAITREEGKSYVYTSTGGNTDKDFTRTEVTLGLSDGIKVEVLSGLKGTEKLRGLTL